MNTVFSVILDDFLAELRSLEELMALGQDSENSGRVRVASINSVTLILAATFEEFTRQMALEHARQTVQKASSLSALPDALLETAWRRTLDELNRKKVEGQSKRETLSATAAAAKPKFDAICRFLDGDIEQDIFGSLIHNENNMRGGEINSLFKVSGTTNICQQICDHGSLKGYFDEEDSAKVGGRLLAKLEEFFERRNGIAHSLNAAISESPETLRQDLRFFEAVAKDLNDLLYHTVVPVAPSLNSEREGEVPPSTTDPSESNYHGLSWFRKLFAIW